MPIQPPDKSVLKAAKNGNLAAFEQILFVYEKAIYNYLCRLVGDRFSAEDLTQEAFIKLYKNIKKLDPDQNPKSWIYKIATNAAYDFLRKKKHVTELFIIDDPESNFETIDPKPAYTEIEQMDVQKDVGKALDTLKPEYKTVLLLFYRYEKTYEEIASIVNKPINTIKTYLHRAKKALKERLTIHDSQLTIRAKVGQP